MATTRRQILATSLTLAFSRRADPPTPRDGDAALSESLIKIRDRQGCPGLIAALITPDGMRVAAAGFRKSGSAEAFLSGDLVHLGSCTKAMTATLIATLVEEGKVAWDTTLAKGLPGAAIDAGYRDVTLRQLLTHQAGLPANTNWWGLGSTGTTTEQRREIIPKVLAKTPERKPGQGMLYSNVGYALAGLIAEEATGQSWEDLMRARLFEPLEMKTAGFGPPGTPGKVDQPWGHSRLFGKLTPNQQDNAAALGPAGTVHCSIGDWAKFARLHLAGERGEKTPILKPDSFRTLHTPPNGEDYACGWVVRKSTWTDGRGLWHNGSNTSWYAQVWICPARNAALLAVTNDGSKPGQKACDEAIEAVASLLPERNP